MAHPIVILLFLILSASVIIIYSYSKNYAENRVKGVSKSVNTAGFSVNIKSSDSWDFVEYLCSDLDNCTKNSTISGGRTSMHELIIMKGLNWENINYVKVFARPGWGSESRRFSLVINNQIAKPTTLMDDGKPYEALILPVEEVTTEFIESVAVFSD